MNSIETTQVDNYVQTTCLDRTMPPAARGLSAAAALYAHVMQEFRLPMDTTLPIDEEPFLDQIEDFGGHCEALMEQVMDTAKEALDEVVRTDVSGPETVHLVSVAPVPEGEGFPGSNIVLGSGTWVEVIDDTIEGDAHHWRNDDKEEQE